MLPGDTLYASEANIAPQSASWRIEQISGCGKVKLAIVLRRPLGEPPLLLGSDIDVAIRGADQTAQARGAVDRFDIADFNAAYIAGRVGCWDLDWTGGPVGAPDLGILSSHASARHHIPRKLLTPNGSITFDPGGVVPITWQAGLGDSARVTLRVVHTSPTDTTVVASDLLDTGSYNWTIPATQKAGTSWRMEVLHSAGYYKVDSADVGKDRSDTTITLRANAVSNLAAGAGKNTAVLWWSDPLQGTLTADAHEIRYLMGTPITEANFASGTPVASPPAPYVVGSEHCVELSGLTSCRTYSFAMRTQRQHRLLSVLSKRHPPC